MAIRSELKFPVSDNPKWRGTNSVRTAEMIDDIVKFRKDFCDIREEKKISWLDSFVPIMAVDFVYNVNVGEQVGLQTRAETEEILKPYLKSVVSMESDTPITGSNTPTTLDTKRRETLNTLKALKKLYDMFVNEMDSQGFLTVDQVCEVHGVLMKDLHRDAGKIRCTKAFTTWNGVHFYPEPEKIEGQLYALVDRHNIYVEKLPQKYSREEVEYIIKCAARIMFHFVDTHPFGDGNGRTCHLLANYVLTLITPFPVSIYHTDSTEGISREDYVDAIVQCRDHPEEGPCDIAAMLVEGVWKGWKNLFRN